METNMIDRCLAKVEAGNVVKRYICEELLFFLPYGKKRSTRLDGLKVHLEENERMFGSCLKFVLQVMSLIVRIIFFRYLMTGSIKKL